MINQLGPNNPINADSKKRRSFLALLLSAGYGRRSANQNIPMKPKIIAAALFLAICILVAIVGVATGSAKQWLIEFALPKELEQVTPVADLVTLPVGFIISLLGALKLVASSALDFASAVFDWQLEPGITAFYLMLAGLLGVLTNAVFLILSLPVALLAAAIGWLLTLSVVSPGVTSTIVLLGLIWGGYVYIKKR